MIKPSHQPETASVNRFILVFALIVALLFTLELLPWGQAWLVRPWTDFIADVSAGTMRLFDDRVLAQGKLIWDRTSGFAVAIEAGCNGVEAAIILMAAMLAFPADWRRRAIGIALGLTTVQTLNILRIISLFYLGQWNRTVFEWAHLYVWQALIMLDVLLVFLFWLRWVSRQSHAESPAREAA